MDTDEYVNLHELKATIIQIYVDLGKDDRGGLLSAFYNLQVKPLIEFGNAYRDFITSVTNKSDSLSRWMNIQMQVITVLGEYSDSLVALYKLFNKTLKETPGGDGAVTMESEDAYGNSYLIALAFRIYLDAIVPTTEKDRKVAQGNKNGDEE